MIKPTVGRNVHYYGVTANEPVAAIITRVHSDVLVDVGVFPQAGTTAPMEETLTELRLRQDDEGYPKGARAEWPPWVVEEEAFRKNVDDFADKMTVKADTITKLIERELGAMNERLWFVAADHRKTAKLVADQADSLVTVRGQLGELHDRLSALAPTPETMAKLDDLAERARAGPQEPTPTNAPDAVAEAT